MEFVANMVAQALERIVDGDLSVWSTAWRTIRLALESTAFALLVGLPLGFWLGEARTRARRAGAVVANAGLGLPPVVLGVFLALLLLPASPLGPLRWTSTLNAVILAQTLLSLPIVVALTAAAVAQLPPGLLDQARAYGAPGLRRALLALREARVGVLAAVMAAFGSALAEVGAVVIVGGNIRGQTDTLASAVLLDLSAGDPAGATAHVLVLIGLVLLVGAVLTLLQQRFAA
jgi:tungstate transport system permease protein